MILHAVTNGHDVGLLGLLGFFYDRLNLKSRRTIRPLVPLPFEYRLRSLFNSYERLTKPLS